MTEEKIEKQEVVEQPKNDEKVVDAPKEDKAPVEEKKPEYDLDAAIEKILNKHLAETEKELEKEEKPTVDNTEVMKKALSETAKELKANY
jgi:hypothetical protein